MTSNTLNRSALLALLLAVLLPATGLAIDSCFEFPLNGSVNVDLNIASIGKGMDLFCLTTDEPIQIIPTTAVSISFAAGPAVPACTANDDTPAAGQCGFVTVDTGGTPDHDTLRIFFGGLLPPSDTVTVDVQDVADSASPTPDTLSTSWSFSTSASAPRDPAAVELVFDISGSMGWPAVPGGLIDRMTALKTAANSFFGLLGDYTISGDQVGAIYFSNTASSFDGSPVLSNLKDATDATAVGNVQADIALQTPTNATSIGAGLALADTTEGFDTTTARKFVLLFSDGEQNRSPTVGVAGNNLQLDGVNYDSTITVCPITAGNMTAVGYTLQQSIADASCDGNNAHIQGTDETFLVADLESFFLQNLSDILIGDKLELVRDLVDNVANGDDNDHAFLANPDDLFLTILLSWRMPTPNDSVGTAFVLPFELRAPDGTLVDLLGRTRFRPGMSFTTLRLPAIEGGAALPLAGEWQVRVRGDDLPFDSVDYHLVVMLDNTTIASEFSIGADEAVTGEDLDLSATLTEFGVPVTGATVVAALLGPNESLGEVLSDAPDGTAPGDNPQNPVAAGKLFELLNDPASAALLADADLGTVTLEDPDNDGVYTGVFPGSKVDEEGHYNFRVEVAADGTRNGSYQRTRKLSIFMRPKPDPQSTDLEIVGVSDREKLLQVTIQATPRDRFKNRIGPGYLGALQINSSAGTATTPVADLGNGSYQVVYEIAPGVDPEIELEVLTESVEKDRLSDLDGSELVPGLKRNRWSIHAGLTDPHGTLAAVADGSVSVGVDYRWALGGNFDLELYLGHDRFDATAGSDPDFTTLLGRARWYLTSGGVRPSIFGGVGPAHDGSDIQLALEVGGAVEFPIATHLDLELSYAHRNVDSSIDYGVAQVGLLFSY